MFEPERDERCHERGCEHFDMRPCTDILSTHVDLFCECHHFTQPVILRNGTDIAWPAGWGTEQAVAWRQAHDLARLD